MPDSEMDFATSSFYTQSSIRSEVPSPLTPTFSTNGHLRFSSSASSIDFPYSNPVAESPSSPVFAPRNSKRSLPDVEEEPHERDEDFDMFDDSDELYDCLCKFVDFIGGLHRTFVNKSFGEYS